MGAEIQTIACGNANAYLVQDAGGSILVDTGTQPYRDRVLECCQARNVRLILLTHGHVDHCQNAAYLAQGLGCPVGISRDDAPLLAEGGQRRVTGEGLWGRLYAGASNWLIAHSPIPPHCPEVLLEEGTSLLPYGVDGRVVALPGHTAGSVGVLLAAGELLVGDAMQSIFRPAPPWCYENKGDASASVDAIRRLHPSRIYCGHGRPSAG